MSLVVSGVSLVLALRAERRAARAEGRAVAAEREARAASQRPRFLESITYEGGSVDVPFLVLENTGDVGCVELTVQVKPVQGVPEPFRFRDDEPWRLTLRAGGRVQHPLDTVRARGGRIEMRYEYVTETGQPGEQRQFFDVPPKLWIRVLRAVTLTESPRRSSRPPVTPTQTAR